jgi:hypothetical protein
MKAPALTAAQQALLFDGTVIPAHPLALDERRRLDERRQRALTRYYLEAGAGGIAVGVHTTQFAIRDPKVALLEPVLALAAETVAEVASGRPILKVAGLCGPTEQALAEAELATSLGYDLGLLSMAGLGDSPEEALLERARAIVQVIPVFGFYLQPTVGGRVLSYAFWRAFSDIDGVTAIKIAPFDRYGTLDVVRAVCASDRRDAIALYTGNDDTIIADLLTPYRFRIDGRIVEKRIVGGLLGQWAVWTSRAVELLEEVKRLRRQGGALDLEWLARNVAWTDANAAIFDAANGFRGCIPGIHEVLRRQGLLVGRWCLDPEETLSPGQAGEIDRVYSDYPQLSDDAFVEEGRDRWLSEPLPVRSL